MERLTALQLREWFTPAMVSAMDAKRCSTLLRTLCPEHRRDVNILAIAFEESVVPRLQQTNGRPPVWDIEQLTEILYENTGLERDNCRWAISTWAEVLNIGTSSVSNDGTNLTAGKSAEKPKDVSSSNLQTTSEPLRRSEYTAHGIDFAMRLSPGGMFAADTNDSGAAAVGRQFWIAETQVTYELWYTVRQWASSSGYTFTNRGMEGSTTGGGNHPKYNNIGNPPTDKRNEPVTMISWRDSVVWCNALSELLGCVPVYTYLGSAIKDSTNALACDSTAQETANGFRLPTSDEWTFAARYKGEDSSNGAVFQGGLYWTPERYASGAAADYNNAAATQAVAWYWDNSDRDGTGRKTQPVGLLRPNQLGVYDMSGNVWEWCFTQRRSDRVFRGGCFSFGAGYLQVGNVYRRSPDCVYDHLGLRVVRAAL